MSSACCVSTFWEAKEHSEPRATADAQQPSGFSNLTQQDSHYLKSVRAALASEASYKWSLCRGNVLTSVLNHFLRICLTLRVSCSGVLLLRSTDTIKNQQIILKSVTNNHCSVKVFLFISRGFVCVCVCVCVCAFQQRLGRTH